MDCREAFERSECEKYGNNYDDMKKNWDWYESQYGWRYPGDSPRGKSWVVWQKAWESRQSEVDELQKQKSLQELEINQISQANQQLRLNCDGLQIRMDEALKTIVTILQDTTDHYTYLELKELEQALKGGTE